MLVTANILGDYVRFFFFFSHGHSGPLTVSVSVNTCSRQRECSA